MYEKVKNQYEHAIKFEDPIARFNLLWMSFNCFYNIKLGNNGNDRQKIDNLKRDEKTKQVFIKLDNQIYFDFIKSRNGGKGGVKNIRDKKVISYLCKDCFGEYLETVYTIRNNQFHGSKDPKDENDNELLKATSLSFKEFLINLYESENVIKVN